MGTLGNAGLGILFWVVALTNTLLMFKLWGYPYDHDRLVSSAPRPLMLLHRVLGYLFAGLYLYLMMQMVPRLWTYQVELPARTVVHVVMGLVIGSVLLVKILIVRVFRHLESSTAPFLGITLLVATTVLVGLSAPIALREAYLGRDLAGGAATRQERLDRVRRLLPDAGLPKAATAQSLATPAAMVRGRQVLLTSCVQCHDLRTVLAKPRTPAAWVETVRRMAERAVLDPIPEPDQWHVAAYLVAISPDLQRSVQRQRHEQLTRVPAEAVRKASPRPAPPTPVPAPAPAAPTDLPGKAVFESTCNGCHTLTQVDDAPPRSESEARELVSRMVDNGLAADPPALEQIIAYLAARYAR